MPELCQQGELGVGRAVRSAMGCSNSVHLSIHESWSLFKDHSRFGAPDVTGNAVDWLAMVCQSLLESSVDLAKRPLFCYGACVFFSWDLRYNDVREKSSLSHIHALKSLSNMLPSIAQ